MTDDTRQAEIIACLNQVVAAARRIARRSGWQDVSELESAGFLGLVEAAKTWDGRGRLAGWAMVRARGAMKDRIRTERGDERRKTRRPKQLDGFDLETLPERRSRPTPAPLIAAEASRAVALAAEVLKDRGWQVLQLRYGREGLTLAEVGKRLNLTEARAYQIEVEALEALRAALGIRNKKR